MKRTTRKSSRTRSACGQTGTCPARSQSGAWLFRFIPSPIREEERRGTIIIIVLALLGALSLMGFLIYSIASEDEVSAEYFANAGKVFDPGIDPNSFFNFTLRQVILGADINERQSALWGGRHSLLPTMLGRDFAAFSGEGTNLVMVGGVPVVDRNYDNADDAAVADADLRSINLSASAQGFLRDLNDLNNDGTATDAFPEPDVDYTAPDINNTFLAYDALVPNGTAEPVRVIKPSYHVPQILRGVVAPNLWYSDPLTTRKVLHPHVEHVAFPSDWVPADPTPNTKRFVSAGVPEAGMSNFPFPGELGADTLPGVAGVDDDGANGIDDAGELGWPGSDDGPPPGYEGVWINAASAANVNYGADPDGDGISDAFWMDLDFPIMEVPGSGQKFIAMAAISVKDLDALLNLNVHGNAEGKWALADTTVEAAEDPYETPFAGASEFLSRSNQGAGPWEVNPLWALNARPTLTDYTGPDLNAALEQYRFLFRDQNSRGPANNPLGDHATNVYELANMELWRLLHGGAQIVDPGAGTALGTGDLQQSYLGRWGEVDRLAGTNGVIITRNAANSPFPGVSLADDNNNGLAAFDESGVWTYASAGSYPAFVYPLDYFGSGRTTTAVSFGKSRQLLSVGAHVWPIHDSYKANAQIALQASPSFNLLMPNAVAKSLVDEPAEMIISPNATGAFTAIQKADNLFGPDEALMQLSDSIFKSKLNSPGRAAKLASFGFNDSSRAAEIRQRFTPVSWDLKAYGKPFLPAAAGAATARTWEYTNIAGTFVFPPTFTGAGAAQTIYPNAPSPNQPFRQELHELLLSPNVVSLGLKPLQRMLSVNGVLDRATNGRLRFRPLTPHPVGLAATAVSQQLGITRPEQVTSTTQQEWLARYDRQRMARDIYVLLYTMGGSKDGSDYTTEAGNTLYPGKQREEMAQFAVNVVDAMDPDNIITQFVYDKDLSDGWNIADDYRYDDPAAPGVDAQRGVAFGVERQMLALNEAMVLLAKRVSDGSGGWHDHPATEYLDDEHRNYTYIEIENVSPFPVDFANSGWQILVKQGNVTAGTTYIGERRLTLRSGLTPISSGANSRFTIGSAGDGADVVAGVVRPSFVRIDPNGGSAFQRIAPRGALDLDLMLAPFGSTNYVVTKPLLPTAPPPFGGDGEVAVSLPTAPAGGELLDLSANDTDYDVLNNGDVEVEIQLRRRVNLQRAEPSQYNAGDNGAAHLVQTRDNPWVVVDQIKVPLSILGLADADNSAALIGPKLENIRSKERIEPLFGTDIATDPQYRTELGGQTTVSTPTYQGNSLGNVNDAAIDHSAPADGSKDYVLWHPHFDRDFATVGEVFNVPLWGPFGDTYVAGAADGQQALDDPTVAELINGLATRRLGARHGEVDKAGAGTTPILVGDDYDRELNVRVLGAGTAGYRIMHPEGRLASDQDLTTDITENRWHRALALLEVPSRMERHADNPAYTIDAGQINATQYAGYRTPGKINLNTLRHPEGLAGLLDDKDVFRYWNLTTIGPNKEYLHDLVETTLPNNRDWWTQFVLARDGLDAITGLPLPGIPPSPTNAAPTGSRPFRSLGYSIYGDVHAGTTHNGSLEHTIFRSLRMDDGVVGTDVDDRRRLFELGTKAEHDDSGVDYTAKHRLLSKIMNNTTTRSNTFVICMEVAFFEAKEVLDVPTNKNVVRIGGRIPTTDTFKTSYRGFFVVDRSKAMELLTPEDLPKVDPGTNKFVSSFNQRFNYNALVLYRRVMPD